jgi:hypothetical protein
LKPLTAIRKYYDSMLAISFQGESPAYQTHFLDLDPNYRDRYGNPLLRITFDWEPNERKMVAFAGTKTLEIVTSVMCLHPPSRRPSEDRAGQDRRCHGEEDPCSLRAPGRSQRTGGKDRRRT